MKFLDQAKIYLKSGDGGAGCISFRREKYIEFGGPDGGNGGRGGDVYFETVNNMNTLIDYRYQQHFKAQTGMHGMGQNRSGKKGDDIILKVPVGTQILDENKGEVLADLTELGERFLFLQGGDGGFGNAHYKSSTNQAPRKKTPGWPGQEMTVWLRLKLIADAGLIGLPNAGKSTFLSVVSRAKPKIADYPFTTLHPNLGVVKAGSNDFVIADIPGLIEGAHAGHGLGHRFLGHVERTRVLVHLIDGTDENIVENYQTIQNELKEYGCGLTDKPQIVALNKKDSLSEEALSEKLKELETVCDFPIIAISAVTKDNVDQVLYKVADQVILEKKTEENEGNEESTEYRPEDH